MAPASGTIEAWGWGSTADVGEHCTLRRWRRSGHSSRSSTAGARWPTSKARSTVRTRTGRDVTANVPHLQGLAKLGRHVVLDGELIADAARANDFYRLGGRVRSSGTTGDVTFVAFDVLVLDGRLICYWHIDDRRAAPESLELVGAGLVHHPIARRAARANSSTRARSSASRASGEARAQPVPAGHSFRRLAEARKPRNGRWRTHRCDIRDSEREEVPPPQENA